MEELYTDMAAAIKRRNHAINMLNRWQAVLAGAEQEMTKLSGALAQVSVPAEAEAPVADEEHRFISA